MSEINNCSTCKLLAELKEKGEYYAKRNERRRNTCVSVCKSAVIVEDYIVENENEFYHNGRVTYNPRPLNFCSECGRKISEEEISW